MPRSRKSSRNCQKKQIYIKSYKRSSGKRVKGHCSRPKGPKSRRSSVRRSYKKLVCSPPKSMKIRSYKRSSGKRVKAHCSLPRGGKRSGRVSPGFQEGISREEREMKYEEPSFSPCQDKKKVECVEELDSKGLRRCRYNYKSQSCEDLPETLRERATFQVGGSAEYVPYQAGERAQLKREQIAPFQQGEAFYL